MKCKLEGDVEEYMRAISKLDDDNHIILSLQNAIKINKWDLAAEYVNNNLLSSPDTHLSTLLRVLQYAMEDRLRCLLRAAFLLRDIARTRRL